MTCKSFLACARYKSFRNAADLLGVTSTTLMRRIDRLEERIGCRLFLRDQSGLTISEEGLAMIADLTEMERHALQHLPPRIAIIRHDVQERCVSRSPRDRAISGSCRG